MEQRENQGAPWRSHDDATPTSVRIVIVLFANDLAQIWRCVRSVARTAQHALDHPQRGLNVVAVQLGDCSDRPLLRPGDVDDLAGTLELDGRGSLEYRWFGKNMGHSAGSNDLAAGATEDALLLLNPDTYAAPTLLAQLLRALRDPAVVAADARQIPCEHPKFYDPISGDQSWASGACLLARTASFREVGGFDATTFPSYVNDVDLSWRLRANGGRIVHQPRAVIFHDKRLTQSAGVAPTAGELYSGALGGLLLATKFGRPEVAQQTMSAIVAHGATEQQRAVRQFEQLRTEGRLPEHHPDGAWVAEFVAGDYGPRRF